MKRITLLIAMLFITLSGFSQIIWQEGFEGTSLPGDVTPGVWSLSTGDWAVFTNGVGPQNQQWTVNTGIATPPLVCEGSRSAYINRENVGIGNTEQDFLATQSFTVPADGQLQFTTRLTLAPDDGTIFKIMFAPASSLQNNPDAYTVIHQYTELDLVDTYNLCQTKTVDLSALAGMEVYLAFVREYTQTGGATGGDRWLVDNVQVVNKCLSPTAPASVGNTQSAATLTWGNPAGATTFELEILPLSGTPSGSGTLITASGDPVNYTVSQTTAGDPFTPNTCYNYYVRALCSSDNVPSEWVGPINFCTAQPGLSCASAIAIPALPYSTTDNTGAYADNTDTPQPSGCVTGTTNYMAGNEAWYSYTPTADEAVSITMTPTASNSSIFVYDGCSNTTVACLAGVANNTGGVRSIPSVAMLAGHNYIIVISSSSATQTVGYTLVIQHLNCAAPTGLSAVSTGPGSADLSWGNPGAANSWEVAVQTPGSPIPAGAGLTANTNSHFGVTSLLDGTPLTLGCYQYWVRADCGDGTFSPWAGPYNFCTTNCASGCTYNFVMTDSFGDGWNGNTMTITQDATTTTIGSTFTDGLGPITVPVTFCEGPFTLTWNSGGNFATEVGISVVNSFGQTIYVHPSGTNLQGQVLFNGLANCTTPACLPPATVAAANAGTHTAELTWTTNGPIVPVSWDIIAVPAGGPVPDATTPATVTIAGDTTQPYTISGLLADTTYTFYFRAVCDGSETSDALTSSNQITTLPTCPKPTALAVVGLTDLDAATFTWTAGAAETQWEYIVLPAGSPVPDASAAWLPATAPPFTVNGLVSATNYDFYVRAICSDTDASTAAGPLNFHTSICAAANQCLYTFTMTDSFGDGWNGNTMDIRQNGVTIATIGSTFTDGLGPITVQVPICHGIPFELFWNNTGNFATEVGVSITSFLDEVVYTHPSGTNLQGTSLYTGTGECIPPTCPKPNQLVATAINSTTEQLAWNNNGSTATQFEVLALPCGSPIPTDTTVGTLTSDNPYTFTGLIPGTCYDFYVRAICSDTDHSFWSNPKTATTAFGCGGQFVDSGGPNGQYQNNENLTWTICPDNPGEAVTVTFTAFNTEATWDGLYVYDGNSTSAPQIASTNGAGNGPLTTPGAFWGPTIPGPFTSSNPDGCLTFQFKSDGSGIRDGWTAAVTCGPAPTCFKPLDLTATQISQTSALLGWTQPESPGNPAPNQWEIIIVPTGSPVPLPTDTGTIVTINPVLITGLTPGTQYTYYVRAICGDGTNTLWSNGFNFVTLPSNDECSGAIPVPVNSNSTCNQTVSGTVAGATASGPASTCLGTADDDVWYQFVASNSYLNLTLYGITGSSTNLNYGVYSGTCDNLTLVQCSTAGNNTTALVGLTIGTTYYLRIWSNQSTPQTSNFSICISTPSSCSTASYACSTQSYSNTTQIPNIGTVGCLFTAPNPRFFIVQVATSGPINFLITQGTTATTNPPNLDVDFAAWGPFVDPAAACDFVNTPTSIPDEPLAEPNAGCSYSAAPTENWNLTSAVAGQYYVLLVTNFSNQPGVINLNQTNAGQPGSGTVFCCDEANFSYAANAYCTEGTANPTPTIAPGSVAGTFTALPAGLVFVDAATGEIDLAASQPGVYVVTNTVAATAQCPERHFDFTLTISSPPVASISYDQAAYCQNDPNTASINFTGTPGGFYSSAPVGLFIDPTTATITPGSSAPGIYTVTYTLLNAGACSASSPSTQVEIIASPVIDPIGDVTVCDSYTLPELTAGNYYTGPGGTGEMLDPAVPITQTQMIYVYQSTNTTPSCSSEQSFTVTVNTTPVLDPVFDISTCENSVLLPALSVGSYYTAPGGGGSIIDPAVPLTADQTVYVYAANGDCTAESSFQVTLGEYTVTTPGDQVVCDSYTLPDLAPGVNYYTDVNGTGTMMNAGDVITQSMTLHVYGVSGDCSDDKTFTITINTAVADDMSNVSACVSYTLGALSVGNTYWSAAGGPSGGGTQYNPGDVISSVGTTTIWIWAESGTVPNCTDQSSFDVTIGQVTADTSLDIVRCDHYTLPALSAGNHYYNGPDASQGEIAPGTDIMGSQLIYIYAGDATCHDQSSFFVTINQTPVLSPIQNVSACDSYTLPSPQAGAHYYSASGGVGQLSDNEVITAQGTTTVYEYAQTGTAPDLCSAEASFTVTITPSPSASQMQDVTACDSYVLQAPASGTIYTQQGGGGTPYDLSQPVSATTTFYVYASNGSCSNQTSFTVTITPSPVFTIDSGCQGAVFVLTASATNFDPSTATYQWSAGAGGQVVSTDGASATVSGAATYSVMVTSGDCTSSAQTIAVDNTGCLIQKGISPNGDGMNDTFDLAGQNVSHLEIFNRYGTKVYEKANYTNQWGGQSDNGQELPDGVYYYVIRYTAGDSKTGWIYINREQN